MATFRLLTAGLPQAMRSSDYAVPFNFLSQWSAVIGALWFSLFMRDGEVVPSAVPWCTIFLSCFLTMGIHASGILAPPSLLKLLGGSLMWIAFLILREYQCEFGSINSISFQSGQWPVWWACSAIGYWYDSLLRRNSARNVSGSIFVRWIILLWYI